MKPPMLDLSHEIFLSQALEIGQRSELFIGSVRYSRLIFLAQPILEIFMHNNTSERHFEYLKLAASESSQARLRIAPNAEEKYILGRNTEFPVDLQVVTCRNWHVTLDWLITGKRSLHEIAEHLIEKTVNHLSLKRLHAANLRDSLSELKQS